MSEGDLEANRSGGRFYEDLAEAMQANPAKYQFDICEYVNRFWNEENNPSDFIPSMRQLVFTNRGMRPWSGRRRLRRP